MNVTMNATINAGTPTSANAPPEISLNANTDEPKITGTDSKNEYLTAVSLFNPDNKAVTKVEPEREIPGNTAIVCPIAKILMNE